MGLIRAKTHHLYTITFALLTVPLWSSAWIAGKIYGDLALWRPWLLLTARGALPPDEWTFSIKAGFVGALLTGAALFHLCENMVFGVTSTNAHGDARWAKKKEIKKAGLLSDWGIVLGKLGKPRQQAEYLRAQTDEHATVLLSGPPRSGKGVGIIVPTCIEYPGSFIAYDVKGELFELTARRRVKKNDKVLVFSPFDMVFPNSPEVSLEGRSHSFNPLLEIAALPDLENRLIEIGKISSALLAPKSYGGTEASLMEDADMIFKAAASIVCNEPNPSIGRILQILTPAIPEGGQAADYKSMFAGLAARAPEPISRETLMRLSGQDNKQLGIYTSVLLGGGLKAWQNPAILRATQKNDFDFSKLRWEAHSIYLCIPEAYKQEASPVIRLFFQHAINVTRKRLIASGENFLPLLFAIDEFHSLGRMPGVLDAVTTLPGYGGRMLLVVQSPASLREHYGPSGENIILESAHLHVWLTPNNDETKQKLSKTLGNETIPQKSISGKAWSSKSSDSRSESWSEKGRELLTSEEVGRLGKEEVIITGKGMFPIRTHRVTWFQDPGFQRFHNEQKSVPWPEIPIVKHGAATTFDEFMRDVNAPTHPENAQSQFADLPPDNPAETSPEQAAAPKQQASPELPAPSEPAMPEKGGDKDSGQDTFADFAENGLHLTTMMQIVSAPELPDWYDTLGETAPISKTDSPKFARAARRLSPAELIARLTPLFQEGMAELQNAGIKPGTVS